MTARMVLERGHWKDDKPNTIRRQNMTFCIEKSYIIEHIDGTSTDDDKFIVYPISASPNRGTDR